MKNFILAALLLVAGAQAAPAPAADGEARRRMLRGQTAMKVAKSAEDFIVAAKEFDAASAADPKLAGAAYNAGVAYEKGGDAATAITRFNAYLAAAPKAKDAQAVKDRVVGLEFLAEKAADMSGCWRDVEYKPVPGQLEEECTFVIEKNGEKGFRVRPWLEKVDKSGNGVPSHVRMSVLEQSIDGRKARFLLSGVVVFEKNGQEMSPSRSIYDLTLSPDGSRFNGTLHYIWSELKIDKTSQSVLARNVK